MEENNKWVGLIILAIVAIVAVVGLILLFKGFTTNIITGSAINQIRMGVPLTQELVEQLKGNEALVLYGVDDIYCPGIQEKRLAQDNSEGPIQRELNCYIISSSNQRI